MPRKHIPSEPPPRLIEREDDKLVLNWHEGQVLTLESLARFIFVLKGMQGGFTSGVMRWLHNEMKRCGPGSRDLSYLALTPTLQVARNKLIPTMRGYFEDELGFAHFSESKKVSLRITERGEQALWGHRQAQPTHIYFCYADTPNSFAGFTALAAIGDEINQEEFKRGAWTELRGRLSIPAGMVAPHNPEGWDGVKMGRFCGGTTVYTLNWLEEFYNEWLNYLRQGKEHPEYDFIRYDSRLNPAFSQEEWDAAQRAMPDWLFDMRYRALFRRPAGVIFEDWDPSRHVVAPFTLPAKWPRSCAIDFGRKNFHALLIAHDEERNRHFVYKSYHPPDLSNADRAREILGVEPRIDFTVAGQISEDAERIELAAGGLMAVAPRYKSVWPQINNMAAAIKLNRLYLFRGVPDDNLPPGWQIGCPDMEDELRTYSRPIDPNTGTVDMSAHPVDKDKKHWIDCGLYYTTHRMNFLDFKNQPVAGGRESLHSRGDMAAQPVRTNATGGILRGSRGRDTALRPSGLRFLP